MPKSSVFLQAPHSAAEIKAHRDFAIKFKGMYGKFRGGSRIRYGHNVIDRMDNILYMLLLAMMYTRPKTQTVLISMYAIFGVTYTALVSPFNAFQKNFIYYSV